MDAFDSAALLATLRQASHEELAGQLDNLVMLLGERQFCRMIASQLVGFARPEIAIPQSLHRFVPLVREGVEFFLGAMSYPRLRRVLLSRYLLREGEEPGERLLKLAVFFPTLHKLGQVIARNPHLDPEVRKWLVGLEHGDYGADPELQVEAVREQLARLGPLPEIDIAPHILAEASVAVVVPFSCLSPLEGTRVQGVFKILKPGIRDDLLEELEILAAAFSFLERNRERYGLGEMKLTSLFREIRGDMAREVDLAAEQKHLSEAAQMYGGIPGVVIPRPLPYSTSTMTAMTYVDGRKIGDIAFASKQRRTLARLIFESVLCLPLFAEEQRALFHGDPHAGNILVVVPRGERSGLQVALLDWTLAGHLTKRQRELVMALLLGIMKDDSPALARVVEKLAIDMDREESDRNKLPERIARLLDTPEYRAADPLRRSFLLLEKMTLEGVVFPSELILFRKAFFTMEGVLHDIDPGFAMGEAMEIYLARLLMHEFPLRLAATMFPLADRPEHYRTLLANRDLKELSLHQSLVFWRQTLGLASAFLGTQLKLMHDVYCSFACSGTVRGGR